MVNVTKRRAYLIHLLLVLLEYHQCIPKCMYNLYDLYKVELPGTTCAKYTSVFAYLRLNCALVTAFVSTCLTHACFGWLCHRLHLCLLHSHKLLKTLQTSQLRIAFVVVLLLVAPQLLYLFRFSSFRFSSRFCRLFSSLFCFSSAIQIILSYSLVETRCFAIAS